MVYLFISPPSASEPRLYVSPASPAKFPEVIRLALTKGAMSSDDVEAVVQTMGRPLDALRKKAHQHGTNELRMDRGQDWQKMLLEKLESINSAWMQ